MVSFETSREDARLLREIADRAVVNARRASLMVEHMDIMMDLTATHANGTPLRLRELLTADDFNFNHDVFGIRRHLNRKTGELEGCFLPRFARQQATA